MIEETTVEKPSNRVLHNEIFSMFSDNIEKVNELLLHGPTTSEDVQLLMTVLSSMYILYNSEIKEHGFEKLTNRKYN
jgi:hypothetical protein